jgi:hypothetical protein
MTTNPSPAEVADAAAAVLELAPPDVDVVELPALLALDPLLDSPTLPLTASTTPA